MDDPLVGRARELARRAHAAQSRKAGGPYFVHLEQVALILTQCGHAHPDVLAAAYLHDLLEDQPHFEGELRSQMPESVIRIVERVTEQKRDDEGRLRPKSQRFDDYFEGLERGDDVARTAICVSCADKIHNARSLVEDEEAGRGLLMTLRTRPGEHREQLARLRALYASVVNEDLLRHFDVARVALLDLIARWLPGRAVMIAAQAHLGQFDKGGAPYIEHPLRLRANATGEVAKMVAVLHDVVEDSHWTLEELRREGFADEVVVAIDHLTRRVDEDYDAFIERVRQNDLARMVKRLDLQDNLALDRIAAPTAADHARLDRYRRALARLD